MPPDQVRILIAASGTGGHLFPALFIAKAFQEILGGRALVEFVGTGRPLEEKVIDRGGFTRHVIKTVGLKRRGLRGLLEFGATLPGAVMSVIGLMRSFRPHVVVGVGGYASFLPVTVARSMGIKTWIHEAELRPGLANAVLSRYAHRVSCAFPGTAIKAGAKLVLTGHPVRPEMRGVGALPDFSSPPDKLLVLGGSQGAQAIDAAMLNLMDFFRRNLIEILHQTRPENVETIASEYARHDVKARVEPFIEDMAGALNWAHIVLGRSGAGAVMEIGVANRPAILVPYPYAQGNHQLENARTLADRGKAIIVEEGALFSERLKQALTELRDPRAFNEMRARPAETRSLGAAEAIAKGCLELAAIDITAS